MTTLNNILRGAVRRWLGVDDNQHALEQLSELFDQSLKSQAKLSAALKNIGAHLAAARKPEAEQPETEAAP